MTGRLGRSTALAVLVTLALGACSGDDNDASADADAPPSSTTALAESTTTLPPEPTTTTTVPLYSFDGSVPPPELVNMGDDYEAIYRSLDAYDFWIDAHNPDPELVKNFAVEGTDQYETQLGDVETLLSTDARSYVIEPDAASVELIDQQENVVSLRVEYPQRYRVLVDRSGNVIDEATVAPRSLIVLMSADPLGTWRLSSVTHAPPADEPVDL